MLIKIDDYIIDIVQEVYNYIWDTFGITKGFISMLRRFLCALLIFLAVDVDLFWKIFWMLFYIATAYRSYSRFHIPQSKGKYDKLNKDALQMRTTTQQKPKLYFIFPLFMLSSWYEFGIGHNMYGVVIITELLATYIITILIREREPTSFSFNFGGAQ